MGQSGESHDLTHDVSLCFLRLMAAVTPQWACVHIPPFLTPPSSVSRLSLTSRSRSVKMSRGRAMATSHLRRSGALDTGQHQWTDEEEEEEEEEFLN